MMKLERSEVGIEIVPLAQSAVVRFDLVAYDDVWLTFVMINRMDRLDVGAMIIAYFVDGLDPDQTSLYWLVLSSMAVLSS